MMDLDAKILAGAGLVYKAIGIDGNNINKEMTFLQLDIILILLQVAVMESGILCLNIVVSLV